MLRHLLSLLFVAAVTGCASRDGDPVHYVLPDGYRGPFRIIADGVGGGGYRHDGAKHIYTIPRNGVLHVVTSRPTQLPHRISAEYASGAKICWLDPPPQAESEVRIRSFGSSDDGSAWFAVGNESEILDLQASWNQNGPQSIEKLLPNPLSQDESVEPSP